MKGPDLDKAYSEKRLSLPEFLTTYNAGLPPEFPRASAAMLKVFSSKYPDFFRKGDGWSLDQHRKKVMDWLPNYMRSTTVGSA